MFSIVGVVDHLSSGKLGLVLNLDSCCSRQCGGLTALISLSAKLQLPCRRWVYPKEPQMLFDFSLSYPLLIVAFHGMWQQITTYIPHPSRWISFYSAAQKSPLLALFVHLSATIADSELTSSPPITGPLHQYWMEGPQAPAHVPLLAALWSPMRLQKGSLDLSLPPHSHIM